MRLPPRWGRDEDQDPLTTVRRQIDRLFDDLTGRIPTAIQSMRGGPMRPAMDVHESEDALELTAELPGVSEKDLDITLHDNVLTVRGEKRSEERREGQNARVVERTYGSFERSLMLPFEADPDRIEADFENGVLRVRVPKPEASQTGARRINVRAGGSSERGSAGGASTRGRQRPAGEANSGGQEADSPRS